LKYQVRQNKSLVREPEEPSPIPEPEPDLSMSPTVRQVARDLASRVPRPRVPYRLKSWGREVWSGERPSHRKSKKARRHIFDQSPIEPVLKVGAWKVTERKRKKGKL